MENRFEKENLNFETPLQDTPEKESFEFKEVVDTEKLEQELALLFSKSKESMIEEVEENEIEEVEEKVDSLITIAFLKGPEHAIKIAQSFNSPYILDAFHDRLVDEVRKRGLNQ